MAYKTPDYCKTAEPDETVTVAIIPIFVAFIACAFLIFTGTCNPQR